MKGNLVWVAPEYAEARKKWKRRRKGGGGKRKKDTILQHVKDKQLFVPILYLSPSLD